jgi:hypothetical protein
MSESPGSTGNRSRGGFSGKGLSRSGQSDTTKGATFDLSGMSGANGNIFGRSGTSGAKGNVLCFSWHSGAIGKDLVFSGRSGTLLDSSIG